MAELYSAAQCGYRAIRAVIRRRNTEEEDGEDEAKERIEETRERIDGEETESEKSDNRDVFSSAINSTSSLQSIEQRGEEGGSRDTTAKTEVSSFFPAKDENKGGSNTDDRRANHLRHRKTGSQIALALAFGGAEETSTVQSSASSSQSSATPRSVARDQRERKRQMVLMSVASLFLCSLLGVNSTRMLLELVTLF